MGGHTMQPVLLPVRGCHDTSLSHGIKQERLNPCRDSLVRAASLLDLLSQILMAMVWEMCCVP
jgi:hypothetical protein